MDLFWLYKILLVLTRVELLFRQRNSFVEEGFFQGLRGKSPFRFKLARSVNLCKLWPRICSCLGLSFICDCMTSNFFYVSV